jgi:hypothetical protein
MESTRLTARLVVLYRVPMTVYMRQIAMATKMKAGVAYMITTMTARVARQDCVKSMRISAAL